jgi:exopolyphosphatase/guanosine-5'-triphosphate,3'-diphosphate pyrophosphatase
MGCVGFTMRYFPDGRVDKRGLKEAELAARTEMQTIVHTFREVGWEAAVGSSGTAKALCRSAGTQWIVRRRHHARRSRSLAQPHAARGQRESPADGGNARGPVAGAAGRVRDHVCGIQGVRTRAHGVLRRARCVSACCMTCSGAITITIFAMPPWSSLFGATRSSQSRRSASRSLHARCLRRSSSQEHEPRRIPMPECWIGRRICTRSAFSVAHSSYHKHSAYILANADMPGFSRMDQGRLARIVLAHRGQARARTGDRSAQSRLGADLLLASGRAAAPGARRRTAASPLRVRGDSTGFAVDVPADWLDASPLTAAMLEDEERQWSGIGKHLKVRAVREDGTKRAVR